MTCAASCHVAVWIDHHQAILLSFEPGLFARSVPHRPGSGWFQHHVDARRYSLMQQYYDAVLSHLEPQDEILILGPGQAKHELRQLIEQHGGLKGKVVGLHYAPRLAEVEMISPMGEVRRSKDAEGGQVASFRVDCRGSGIVGRQGPNQAERET